MKWHGHLDFDDGHVANLNSRKHVHMTNVPC